MWPMAGGCGQACNVPMRNAPSIDISLGPSRVAGAGTGIAALATLVIVLLLPVAPLAHAALCAVVLAWAWETFRTVALRGGTRGVVAVHLGADRVIVATYGNGRVMAGHLRSATYVSATLTAVVWRPDGARRSRAILVMPDMLPAEEFRRFRILLRYARSGVAQGAPASQS